MSFSAKSTFEPKALNWVVKMCFVDFNSILSFDDQNWNPLNYEKEWCTFDNEKGHVEKKKKFKLSTFEVWMFYHLWNIINLHQILNIEMLQVMKLIFEKKIQSKLLCFAYDFSKIQNYNFK
jgi:hypothetical protein